VTILYRRTRAEMPAYEEEVEEAEHEGVQIDVLVAPVEIITEHGRVVGVKCKNMILGEFDRSGRRRPVEGSSGEFTIKADQVIAGIGQRLDAKSVLDVPLRLKRNGFIDIDPVTMQTSERWIFAGGDAVLGPASVVEAIAAGEKAAVGIDQYLSGAVHAFWRAEKKIDTSFDPDADPVSYARAAMQLLPVKKRKNNFQEVELPWSDQVARREAARCLRCDYGKECNKR
jgi:NADH-quinone oxidoreductase subunit F